MVDTARHIVVTIVVGGRAEQSHNRAGCIDYEPVGAGCVATGRESPKSANLAGSLVYIEQISGLARVGRL